MDTSNSQATLDSWVRMLEALFYDMMMRARHGEESIRSPVWIDVVRHDGETVRCPQQASWNADPSRLALVVRIVPERRVFRDWLERTFGLPYVERPLPVICPDCCMEMRVVMRWLFWNTTPENQHSPATALLVSEGVRNELRVDHVGDSVECTPALDVHALARYAARADENTPTEERAE